MEMVRCRALRAMRFGARLVKRGMEFTISRSDADRQLSKTSNFRGAFQVLGPVGVKPKATVRVIPEPSSRGEKGAPKTSAKPRKRAGKK